MPSIELCYVCKDKSLSIYPAGVADNYVEEMKSFVDALEEGKVIDCFMCGNEYEYTRYAGGWTGNKIP